MAAAPPRTRPVSKGDDYIREGRSEWMDIDWRAHQHWLTVAGRGVNVIELGDGPTILFVHGLAGSWHNWLENLPHLARSHRVVALDLPGFGYSEMPGEDVSISGYAECLLGICDQVGIEHAAVVGNSLGGFVGAELALMAPERVSRLVLVAAAVLWNERRRARPLNTLTRVTQASSALLATQWRRAARRRRLRELSFRQVVRHPRRLPGPLAYEQLVHVGSREGFAAALHALYSYSLRGRLPEISCPTLVVWGRDDRLVPVRQAQELAQTIGQARTVLFEDTGHVPQLERPQRFNSVLEEFLAE
jgi:pimeloyl-ACP methyl ester carboxylesterase